MRWTSRCQDLTKLLAMVVLLLVWGCSSSQDSEQPTESTDAPEMMESGGEPTQEPQMGPDEPANPQETPDEVMRRLQERQRQLLEKKHEVAKQYIANANRYLDAGHLPQALKAYADALDIDPKNAEAQSGYNRVSSLLGMPSQDISQGYDMAKSGRQRAAFLAGEHRRRAQVFAREGDYEKAVDEYEKALIILRLNPFVADGDFNEAGVTAALAEAKRMMGEEQRRRESERLKEIQRVTEERERQEQMRVKRQLRRLWDSAIAEFEAERFSGCEELCARILNIDYKFEDARRLKERARQARHEKRSASNVTEYREQWQRFLEEVKSLSMPYGNDPVFPSLDRWTKISARGPIELSSGSVAPDEGNEEVRRTLASTVLPLLDWREQSLDAAVVFLRNTTGVNMIIKNKVNEEVPEEERTLGLSLQNIDALSALKLGVQKLGLAFVIEDQMVKVTTKGDVANRKVLEFHDIRDLTARIRSFPGVEFNLNPSGLGGGLGGMDMMDEEEEENFAMEVDQLIGMIQQTVAPESWEEGDSPASLTNKNGTLVVRQTAENQRAIRRLLDDLRATIGIQVQIQTRFISVENNFLQDVGVDFRGLGDDSAGVGQPGQGTNASFDDFGVPGDPNLPIGTGTDTGAFYSKEIDLRGRTENLFDLALGNPDVLTNSGGLALQYTYLDDTQVEAILRAVQKYERVNEVTAPSLTVYNTQRANLQVSRELAYVKDFDVEIAQASVIADPVVDIVKEGVVLDVRPIVHSDRRFITMELRPTVATIKRPIRLFSSSLGIGTAVTFEVPELRKESLKTTVVIPDGGTLLLGGLKFYEDQAMTSGVPVLKDIPILSFFFSRQGKYTNMRDLIVLLKARILIMEEHEPIVAGG